MDAFIEDSLDAELLDMEAPAFNQRQLKYLESRFNANHLLKPKEGISAERHLGYLQGIREVIEHIANVCRRQRG